MGSLRHNRAVASGRAHPILSSLLRMVERTVSPFDQVAGGDPGWGDSDSNTRGDSQLGEILFASLVGFDTLTNSLSDRARALRGSTRHHHGEFLSTEARAYIEDAHGTTEDL